MSERMGVLFDVKNGKVRVIRRSGLPFVVKGKD
ncbi:hypothetical protein Dtox_2081 [Desulfofarcimen acetoxidans DSM 771]|jgi:hypothetical protein|uniref:Uncharacterized protein n=1 Tax=Desulfofarcimen acetoxidans (strain ATCC 49208 / DSM 771 / KCTC 5769 / VKM B-1644 / 5575) TaxID=485916 RepID=C8VZ00_DESAS|nr:hypothetical protein Dtox_2081 [Desulfofarcimen acetoxidans DSM 771]